VNFSLAFSAVVAAGNGELSYLVGCAGGIIWWIWPLLRHLQRAIFASAAYKVAIPVLLLSLLALGFHLGDASHFRLRRELFR